MMIRVQSVTRSKDGKVYEAVLGWGTLSCGFKVPGKIAWRVSSHQQHDAAALAMPKEVYAEMMRYSYGIFKPKTPTATPAASASAPAAQLELGL